MKLISTVAGAIMLTGGVAKLTRVAAYDRLVEGLDWSEAERRRIGLAEAVGGVLLLGGATRRLGAGVVLAASGAALSHELRAGRAQLAGPRAGVMLAALLVTAFG